MRFMVLVRATRDSENGVPPSAELLRAMAKYNDELAKAGVLLDGAGLKPSSTGTRVRFFGAERTVLDGPFPETRELVAGYWIFETKTKEEAIEWVKRCPNPMLEDGEIEIRPLFEPTDFESGTN